MPVLMDAERKRSPRNAVAAFLRRLELFGPDGVRLRTQLSGEGKRQWPRVAKRMNKNSFDASGGLMKAFAPYDKVHP